MYYIIGSYRAVDGRNTLCPVYDPLPTNSGVVVECIPAIKGLFDIGYSERIGAH